MRKQNLDPNFKLGRQSMSIEILDTIPQEKDSKDVVDYGKGAKDLIEQAFEQSEQDGYNKCANETWDIIQNIKI